MRAGLRERRVSVCLVESCRVLGGRGTGRSTLTALTQWTEGEQVREKEIACMRVRERQAVKKSWKELEISTPPFCFGVTWTRRLCLDFQEFSYSHNHSKLSKDTIKKVRENGPIKKRLNEVIMLLHFHFVLQTIPPFTWPVQGGNVVLRFCLAVM